MGFLKMNLVIVGLFGVAAAIMIPVSFKRGDNWMTVFWAVQFLAMSICFIRTTHRLKRG